jgi:hypothetical protein
MSEVSIEGRIDAVRKKAGKRVVVVIVLENATAVDIADLSAMADGDPDSAPLEIEINDPQARLNLDGPPKKNRE